VTSAPGPSPGRSHWGSRLGFVWAAAGSAVGLGNIWKFPYITGEYGGGAFVLVYLLCIALVGLPLMYSELIIGRRGAKDALGAMRAVTAHHPLGPVVSVTAGVLAVSGGFLILSFYSVVAGWAIHFLAVSLPWDGISLAPGGAGPTFHVLLGDEHLAISRPEWVPILWHTVFMAMTVGVIMKGVHSGIEAVCSKLMPALFAILVLLVLYVAFTGGIGESLAFLFRPSFHKLTAEGALEALGHSFFTLSLGMGAMITYGSYLENDTSVVRDGVIVAVLDTIVALLAGLVIFAVVFAQGMHPSQGPGLVFVTLPDLFAKMPFGTPVAVAFFVLVIFAAWSSAISLLEVVVAFAVDTLGFTRRRASLLLGGAIWLLGVGCASKSALFDDLDDLTTRYLLPLGGLIIAFTAGWILKDEDRLAGFVAMGGRGAALARGWLAVIRFVTPVLLAMVFLWKLGVLKLGK
jgi:neurotransmitter:Na+ symporter, NSS family